LSRQCGVGVATPKNSVALSQAETMPQRRAIRQIAAKRKRQRQALDYPAGNWLPAG